jgi:hypothetical protein
MLETISIIEFLVGIVGSIIIAVETDNWILAAICAGFTIVSTIILYTIAQTYENTKRILNLLEKNDSKGEMRHHSYHHHRRAELDEDDPEYYIS